MSNFRKVICFTIFLFAGLQTMFGQCSRNTEIAVSGGNPSVELCVDIDNLTLTFGSSNRGTQYAYVVGDINNNFIQSGTSSRINFSDLEPGIYHIYGISYSGSLRKPVGQNIFDARLSGGCTELSANFITVSIVDLNAGEVSTTNGSNEVNLCVGDGNADVVSFQSTSSDTVLYRYLITDVESRLLAVVNGNSFDFENAPEGECRVYGLSGSGDILAQPGDKITEVTLTDACDDLSVGYIIVNRIRTDGGEITDQNGNDVVYVCPNNDTEDVVNFMNNGSANHDYRYIITDNAGNIIGLPDGESVDFNDAPTGICRVYGLSFTGAFLGVEGGDISGALASACYVLTSNFITVYRENPVAGTIRTASLDTLVYTCPGDTIIDLVDIIAIGGSNSNRVWVITDNNGLILDVRDSSPINLTDAPEGICRIYSVAYTGNFNIERGVAISEIIFSDDCFDLSETYLEVRRSRPDGGAVSLNDGSTSIELCVGDGMSDLLFMDNNSTSIAPYRYLITDDNNVILGLPGSNFADFESAGDGNCRIWGLSYVGDFSAAIGQQIDTLDLSDDCYDLSDNYIQVERLLINAGVVLTTDGQSEIFICPGDGIDDIISFYSTSVTSARMTYVITNEDNSVLAVINETEINFENTGFGICRVWAIAHTGNVILSGGQNITTSDLATGCAVLSTGYLQVHRIVPSIGDIATTDGETGVLICNGGGSDPVVSFELSEVSDADLLYIITDDQNNVLDIISESEIDFSNAPNGICRIYGLSFTGQLDWVNGDNINSVEPTTTCYDLTDNYIEVQRNDVEGGLVFTEGNMSTVFICPGNGIANLIGFTTTSTSLGNYGYIVTDADNNVIGLPMSNEVDFETAPIGVCRLWGVSYSGDITIEIGQNIILDEISDQCYNRSANFVTVIRDIPNWNELETRDGETSVDVVVGDGIPDIVTVTRDGRTFGLTAIIITDTDGNILGVSNGVSIDFEGVEPGICQLWGCAYTGDLLAEIGGHLNDALSSDCYDLSDNPVTVNRTSRLVISDHSNFAFVEVNEEVVISFSHVNRIAKITMSEEPISRGDIMIHSLQGELIYSEANASQNWSLDLNILNTQSGIYLISYQSAGVIETKRIYISE